MCTVNVVDCANCLRGWAITDLDDCGLPEEEALERAEKIAKRDRVVLVRGSYVLGVKCSCGNVMSEAGSVKVPNYASSFN